MFGCNETYTQIHHLFGSKAKHMKIPVGEWCVIPVCQEQHDRVGVLPKRDQLDYYRDFCAELSPSTEHRCRSVRMCWWRYGLGVDERANE